MPLGSIATPNGLANRALPPAPSREPRVPLPASVVVAPVRGGCEGEGNGEGGGGLGDDGGGLGGCDGGAEGGIM